MGSVDPQLQKPQGRLRSLHSHEIHSHLMLRPTPTANLKLLLCHLFQAGPKQRDTECLFSLLLSSVTTSLPLTSPALQVPLFRVCIHSMSLLSLATFYNHISSSNCTISLCSHVQGLPSSPFILHKLLLHPSFVG